MTKVIETSNENETMAAGEDLAIEILNLKSDKSVVVFLEGELGAGKTTFTKGMLKGFDYNELVEPNFFDDLDQFRSYLPNSLWLLHIGVLQRIVQL